MLFFLWATVIFVFAIMAKTIEDILNEVKLYKPGASLNKIKRAYGFAKKFHSGQIRFSGEPYIDYLSDVACVLLSLKPDEDTLAATFLHDVAKSGIFSLDDICKKFGKNVANLLSGIKDLKEIKDHVKESDVDTLQKMFLAVAQDLRVVLIKLAARLVTMEDLSYLSVEDRKKLARETIDVYVPVAARLGVYTLKSQLEDIAFKYLYPEQYQNINEQLSDMGILKGAIIDDVKKELESFLKSNSVEAIVEGRLKSISSIYRKLKKKGRTSVSEIFDIFAIRVILPTRMRGSLESHESLYSVLGLLHSKWVPLANRFKDYIAVPKSNGYQSLHTTVLGLGPRGYSRPVEIQIRSERMHKEAEYGIASHWLYESTSGFSTTFDRDEFLKYMRKKDEGKGTDESEAKHKRHVEWLHGLAKLQENLQSKGGARDELKLDVFDDRIFVLTPQGEVKDLPVSSTPIDFAYAVHTDVGHRCAMAKVNGAIVPLDHELKNGDIVEIVLKQKSNPKPHWLSFVKTSLAESRIKSFFRSLDRERNVKEGRDLLNKHLRRYGKPTLDDEYSILKIYDGAKRSLRDREGILEEIGIGAQLANVVVRKIFPDDKLLESISAPKAPKKIEKKKKDTSPGILIGGESGLPFKFASCCAPKKDDPIVAYITVDHSVTIHKSDCKYVSNLDEKRILDASWGAKTKTATPMYRVRFFVEAVSRIGLLRDITEVIASNGANIVDFEMQSRTENIFVRAITLDVESFDQFDRILDRIEGVKNVLRVTKDM